MGDKLLLVTDRSLQVVGDPITCWTSIDCTLRYNTVSSGQFTTPAHPWIRDQIEAGHRIVLIRDRHIFMAGPIESALLERSDDGQNSGVGTYTVTWADDLAWIAGRVTYPNPASTPEQQDVDHWTFTGNAELALRTLVHLNAGPGALPARRVAKLVLGDLAEVGTDISVSTRLEPLGDALRSAALAGGGLGFRTRQAGTEIRFEVYAPEDLSNQVRFGFELGNLRYLGYERKAPTATTAIVGGQGEGADRYIIERVNTDAETAWGRIETVVSRPGSSPVEELNQAGDEALAEAGETARLQTSAWDTADQRYGIHYGLGDRVSIQISPGHEVSDLVRLVHLQAWATAGELVSAMVGTQEASHDPALVKHLRQMDRRLGRLERYAVPVT